MPPLSQPRTLILTERVPHRARLTPADVAFLMERHRGRIELLPTGRRNRYRITALGCVGVIVAPMCRLVIRPKIPLPNLFAMLDPLLPIPADSDAVASEKDTQLLDFLAGQFACRLAERVQAGLHRAYRQQSEQGAILHGRLDLPAQLREAPGRKDQLHSQYDDFTADVPCNRALKATAEMLRTSPLLDAKVRTALDRVLTGFEDVSLVPLMPQLWNDIAAERLPADYPPLLELCRLLAEGLAPGEASGSMPAPAFLLDMERLFERHITRGVAEAFADSHYTVSVQRTHLVTEPSADQPDVTMRPDVTVDRDGRPALIVDAKWKRWPKNPDTADLYQVLAYGAALGAERLALVYPGRRPVREYRFAHSPLRLTVYALPLGGNREDCLRYLRRWARDLKESLAD